MKHSILFLSLSLIVFASAVKAEDNATIDMATIRADLDDKPDTEIIALLGLNTLDDKNRILAAIEVVNERKITAASDKLKTLMTGGNADIHTVAFMAFANTAAPTVGNVEFLFLQLPRQPLSGWPPAKMPPPVEAELNIYREAMLTLCRRTTDERDYVVEVFTDVVSPWIGNIVSDHVLAGISLDCLFHLGGEQAAAALYAVTRQRPTSDGDALAFLESQQDKAISLLCRWHTPEAASHLLRIIESDFFVDRQSDSFRAALRMIRQVGLPMEKKMEMAEEALAVANAAGLPDADKTLASEALERFRAMAKGTAIFDGKTFDGWEFRNNAEWFRIEDGAVVGGSMERRIPRNEFLVSVKEYGDFTLRLECKALGAGCNGGIQFRSVRAPADGNMPSEMIGYQADMTDTAAYWGAIYDESRRNRFIAEPPRELIERIFRPGDWNEYEIVAKGNNVKMFLNGVLTVDYTEPDANIPARGFIGLQIHSGPPSETWYRNIRIEEEFDNLRNTSLQ